MANIGSFKRIEDGTISGEIRTLKFKTQARFVPVEDKASEQSPDFRIFAPQRVELGAAWKKVSENQLTYYSVSLDDPSFTAPVYAALIPTEADPTASTWPGPARAARTRTGSSLPRQQAPGRKVGRPLSRHRQHLPAGCSHATNKRPTARARSKT